ncbi:MAG TPA: CDP-diacylglycerol--glycerol-3-phosphate 3-phosphatidyltransferase [Clostridiales bacterium]|nr:CDP-diacylglycerol--glycerol-3-phosphate 3-phosphatidyltransferase [Clostridiales bacterium]
MKKKSMNVPNTLSLLRVALVPVFVVTLIFMREIPVWGKVVPTLIYILTAFTDMLDGKIARKYHLITDFGKFIDPLADKFMVLSSMISIDAVMFLEGQTTEAIVFMFVVLVILLRELGVTSLRLVVAGKSGIVVAASMLGKAKTVSQMVGTVLILLETTIFPFSAETHIVAYVVMGIMLVTTLFSGIDYLKSYLPYIDTNE